MKKRLRKKLKVKEFKQYGFDVQLTFKNELSNVDLDNYLDYFIEHLIEKNGLIFGGGFLPTGVNGFASDHTFGQDTKAKQQRIKEILEKDPIIETVTLGKLVDVWHDKSFKD